jgi:hypothetical protein
VNTVLQLTALLTSYEVSQDYEAIAFIRYLHEINAGRVMGRLCTIVSPKICFFTVQKFKAV